MRPYIRKCILHTANKNLSIAVFLDRDGTIIEDRGYLNHPDLLELIPNASEAIASLNRAGLKTIVVSNQSGVARGYFPESLLAVLHEKMLGLLSERGARIDAVYYCPHHPCVGEPPYRRDCECRKPKTGMIGRAANDFSLDIGRSYFIGDKISDMQTAANAGCKSLLVMTGYGKGEWEFNRSRLKKTPDYLAADLFDAAQWILKDVASFSPVGHPKSND
jgi:D-glycero-D-manno-heptose 1,7-bisphosphate phosphatase